MSALKSVNLALAFVLEVIMLIAFGWWGFHASSETVVQIILGVGSVVLAIAIWGLFFAPRSPRRLARLPLMVGELVIFGLAALALVASGHPDLAIIFAVVVVINQVLIYVWKQ